MATKSTPLYGRITSAQVLEVLKYSSGSDLKTQQAQLTATCNQLEQLSTPSIGLSCNGSRLKTAGLAIDAISSSD